MPKYVYECTSCSETLEIRHSIKEKMEDCPLCDKTECLERVPSVPIIAKRKATLSDGRPAGALVKEFIEDAKRDVSSEKKDLQKREYEG
tara:strand:+ start:242 stop:508 length:267 start_codon:yes stop_codon:yes gene_type:complete